MKNAGVLVSRTRPRQAFGASLAAMLLVLFSSALVSAQSGVDTTASDTWRTAAALAAAPHAVVAASGAAPAEPSNMVPTTPDNIEATAPGFKEIAPALPADASAPEPIGSQPANGSDITRYQEEQSGMPPEQLKS